VTVALDSAYHADFDVDGRVYFSDLCLLGDAYGGTGSLINDLVGDNRIDITEFFVFADVFEACCTGSDVM